MSCSGHPLEWTNQTSSNAPCTAESSEYSDSIFSSLLTNIIQIREQQVAQALISDSGCVDSLFPVNSWFNLFSQGFLPNASAHHSGQGPQDDLLFFVNQKQLSGSKPCLRVLRRNSPNLPPPDDSTVNWEHTVYLNLLMQYFIYVATVAICTRTGPQEVQILRKFSETVYASPSRRRMDSKGTREETVYPNLFFSVDNYSEVFSECTLRDSECLCVELTAYDLSGRLQGVCFLGTIQYGALRKFYDGKNYTSSRWDSSYVLGKQFRSVSNQSAGDSWTRASNMKFMQALGPHGKGEAEFAITSVDDQSRCRCTHSGVMSLKDQCCFCRATSPSDKLVFDSFEHEPITEQPTLFPDNSSPSWTPNELFNDWVCLSVASENGEMVRSVDVGDFSVLNAAPSYIHSAGGSTTTSPFKRRRMPYLSGRMSFTSLTGLENREEYCGVSPRPRGFHHYRSNTRRVSKILGRFARSSVNCNQSDHAQLPSENPDGGTQLDVLANDGTSKTNNTVGLEDKPHADSCSLFSGPERNKRSFGQSWSWFKERRRLTSPPLNAALTYLTLPCDSILIDLLEVRREPILNISD